MVGNFCCDSTSWQCYKQSCQVSPLSPDLFHPPAHIAAIRFPAYKGTSASSSRSLPPFRVAEFESQGQARAPKNFCARCSFRSVAFALTLYVSSLLLGKLQHHADASVDEFMVIEEQDCILSGLDCQICTFCSRGRETYPMSW